MAPPQGSPLSVVPPPPGIPDADLWLIVGILVVAILIVAQLNVVRPVWTWARRVWVRLWVTVHRAWPIEVDVIRIEERT